MADKFLSRPDSKQRILRLDVSPVAPKNESALVVTAERERLTYFVSDPSGVWRFTTRDHDPFRPLSIAPHETYALPWSRRNGAAAREKLGVAVFKRSVRGNVGLYIDLIDLNPSEPRLQTPDPIQIPLRDFGFLWTGIDVWARFVDEDLLIVTQGWTPFQLDLGSATPTYPKLLLLKCPANLLTPDGVANPLNWTGHIMDDGGFDLDVRFEEGLVWAVHRRRGEAASLEVPGLDESTEMQVLIVDSSSNQFDSDFSSLVGDYPPAVVVSCDPASGQPTIVAEDIPSVERPQLHSVNPLIVTGDRIHGFQVGINVVNGARLFTPRVLRSSKWAIWQSDGVWFKDKIGNPTYRQWPLNLEEIAGAQWMINVRGNRVSVATLVSLLPVVMANYRHDEDKKQRNISFMIESPEAGAVVTDFYSIETVQRTELLRWIGRNVLDVGHESIGPGGGQGGATMHPAEHTQFLPFAINVTWPKINGDAVNVNFGNRTGSSTRNTLGALLVADQDLRVGLHAYVGMEDGGGRVVFDSLAEPLPPTIEDRYKSFPPEIMVNPISSGRAWIELRANDWVDSGLPGYFVPLSDMLRGSAVPSQWGEALMLLSVEILLLHFTPRSIGSGLQLQPDVLPVAALMVPDSNVGIESVQPTSFDLDVALADGIQAIIAANAPPSRSFRSNRDQTFPSSFRFSPGVAQVATALVFTATSTAPAAAGDVTFAWTLTPRDGSVPATSLSGATPTFTFPTAGVWTVALVVSAADGSSSTVSPEILVAPTLWTQVWAPQRSVSNAVLTARSTSMEISKFKIDYVTTSTGVPSLVRIHYLDRHRSRLKFLNGRDQQQGRVGLQMQVKITSQEASFRDKLGWVLKLNSLDLSLNYERHFTPAVSTSDRRSLDMQMNRTFVDIDSAGGQAVRSRDVDVETVRRSALRPGTLTQSTPNAITARPVDAGDLHLDDIRLDTELSEGAGTILNIFTVIITLGLAALVFGPILVAVLHTGGPLAALGAVGLLALVSIAIGLGLGAWLRSLAKRVLTDLASSAARQDQSRPENLANIRRGLDDGNLMTYAGEGLSEAIAIMAIRKAIDDGHVVEPPQDPPAGRERFREQFFETIAVGEGVCRVQLRVR